MNGKKSSCELANGNCCPHLQKRRSGGSALTTEELLCLASLEKLMQELWSEDAE